MLSDNEIGDETYSLFYSSLKHPIRRKILRMLAEKPMIYSEIPNMLNIDSGHLSYHLDNLGELITHLPDNRYVLSSFGKAAVRLMTGVEEPSPRPIASVLSTLITRRSISLLLVIAVGTTLLSSLLMTMRFPGGPTLPLFAGSIVAGYLPKKGARVGCVNGLFAALLGGASSGVVLWILALRDLIPELVSDLPPGFPILFPVLIAFLTLLIFTIIIALVVGPVGGALGGFIAKLLYKEANRKEEEISNVSF